MTVKVDLPGVHMAGSNAHYHAHLEVGPHGLALFLAPNAEYPVLDVNATAEQLDELVRDLQSALAVRSSTDADPPEAMQMDLLPAAEAAVRP